ncbi:hypothetical protein [Deinococcus ruber]|nr:hypothetical protein [Deinococcus ruber]
MLHLPSPSAPPFLLYEIVPEPDAARFLASRYGTLQNDVFLPAIPLDIRVQAATALGVPEHQATQDAQDALAHEEAKLRNHGRDWVLICVRTTFGCGYGEVRGVDSSDTAAINDAQRQALNLAVDEDQSWAPLGLSGL